MMGWKPSIDAGVGSGFGFKYVPPKAPAPSAPSTPKPASPTPNAPKPSTPSYTSPALPVQTTNPAPSMNRGINLPGGVQVGIPGAPVTPTPTSPAIPNNQPAFDMGKLEKLLTDSQQKMQTEYDTRMQALQRMLEQQITDGRKNYDDLLNRFNFRNTQLIPSAQPSNDGIHLFSPSPNANVPSAGNGNGNPTPVGTVNPTQYNETLYKYLQNLWGGGF